MPSIGRLRRCLEPKGEGVRVDSGIREGDEISIHYDPMIAKLSTWGKDRNQAIEKMRVALDSYLIRGVTHNIPFLRTILDNPRFIDGKLSTHFIAEEFPEGFGAYEGKVPSSRFLSGALAAYICTHLSKAKITGQQENFNRVEYVRNKVKELVVVSKGKDYSLDVSVVEELPDGQTHIVWHDKNHPERIPNDVVCNYDKGNELFTAVIDGHTTAMQLLSPMRAEPKFTLVVQGQEQTVEVWTPREYELLMVLPVVESAAQGKQLRSPMPGAVKAIMVKVGDRVKAGQEVAVLEAMKMQNALQIQQDGKVKAVHIKVDQTVENDQLLIELE
jgi:propionyl-CoA carboxylase alpha chain